MTLIYILCILVGFGIDIAIFKIWITSYLKREDASISGAGKISVFVIPAWGISGIMTFGKLPQEISNIWNQFLMVLTAAFCLHLLICFLLPIIIVTICNIYHKRNPFDLTPLPPKKLL